MLVSWSDCVELYCDLQNGKPGIRDQIKKVDRVGFGDFIESFKSLDPSKQKWEIQAVKKVMEKIQRLKQCRLDYFATVSDHYEKLCDVFRNVEVDQLWILGNKFPPDQMTYLARICKNCEVKSLMLRDCNLQSEHLIQFAENIGDAKLERLNVSANHLVPRALIHLAKICEICQVKSLDLESCRLDSEHLKLFVDNAKNIKIVEMDVAMNGISKDAKSNMQEFLERNKKKAEREESDRSAWRPSLGEEASSSSKVEKQASSITTSDEDMEKTIRESLSVPVIKASSITTSDEDMEKTIRKSLSVPVIKGELIGPEGGSLDVMECKGMQSCLSSKCISRENASTPFCPIRLPRCSRRLCSLLSRTGMLHIWGSISRICPHHLAPAYLT